MRNLWLSVLCFLCVGIVQAQEVKRQGGSITGRVLYANKGVAGATVTISPSADALSGRGFTLKSVTDEDGRFRLSNLSAGTYYVWPFVPAFVVTETSGVHPAGKVVTLAEAENVEDVDFHLAVGGVITGRVTDSSGRPVIDEQIRLMPIGENERRLVSSIYPGLNEIRTDDRGIYRYFGLPAGKYKVAIGNEYGAFTSTRGKRIFPRTFHPDVTDEAKAKIVELADAEEESNIDITVARAMTGFSASGRFVDGESGKPVPNISFGLTIIVGGRPSGFMSGNGVSTSDGGFRIDNLPPGRYAISILPGSTSAYYGESPPFDIADSDVTDLEAKIFRGATISGNVVIEGPPDRLLAAKISQVRIQVVSWSKGNNIGILNYANLNADGSFQVGPVPEGKATFSLDSRDRNTPAELTLLSIELNGADKSDGVQVTAGEDISGVRLIAGYGTGAIRGSIRAEGGTLPEGTYIDVAFTRPGNSFTIAHQQVDARRRFAFERVPPGNYEIGTTAYLNNKRVTARQSVVVSDRTTTEVTLTLNVSETPQPRP